MSDTKIKVYEASFKDELHAYEFAESLWKDDGVYILRCGPRADGRHEVVYSYGEKLEV